MSRFNEYARKADAYAREAFNEITELETRYREAEAKYNANRRPKGMWHTDAATVAKVARIEADYVEAKDAYEKYTRYTAPEKVNGLKAIRAELVKATAEAFAANPEHVDAATLELLKSGIMTPAEYNGLLERAAADANHTMVRIIAKHASDRADQAANDPETARNFRAVAHKAAADNSNTYLEAFDALAYTFDRCMKNTAMIKSWDDLTGRTVQNF